MGIKTIDVVLFERNTRGRETSSTAIDPSNHFGTKHERTQGKAGQIARPRGAFVPQHV
jgi:ribosomal protein L21E